MWYLPKEHALITPFTSWNQLNNIKICFVFLPALVLSVNTEALVSSAVSSLIYLPKQIFALLFEGRICRMSLTDSNWAAKCGSRFFLQNLKTLWNCCDCTYPISHQGLGGLELAALNIWYNRNLLWAAFCWCILSCSLALTSLSPDLPVSLFCFNR